VLVTAALVIGCVGEVCYLVIHGGGDNCYC